ncbi:MAG: DHA2 family efflux MFS transporter permease subunit, partial [Acidobacteriota bacterium]|nr:DHA2 family efflux MFS transporter permease subunit [Acidobacteriota bacterium]
KRGMAFAVYGMAVVLAPAIGPTLGGWITDHYSWRWIFYVNIPFGILSLVLTQFMVKDPPWLEKSRAEAQDRGVDFLGLVLVALSLGTFQVVLDKGQRDDWFASPVITAFTAISVSSMIFFLIWDWNHKYPIVNLKLFRNRNYAACNALMFLLGVVLLGTTVLIPQYLQTLLGYTAQKAGEVLTPGGFTLLLLLPLVGRLVSKVDARWLIALGFLLSGLTLIQLAHINVGIDFHTAVWWRIDQTASLAFLFVPINTISYIGIPQEENNQVSAMINLMRNIGSSVGISVFSTMLARRQQVHQTFLGANVASGNLPYEHQLRSLTNHFSGAGASSSTAGQQALAAIYQSVQRQAAALAYVDVIWIFVIASFVGMLAVLFAKRNKPGQVAVGH